MRTVFVLLLSILALGGVFAEEWRVGAGPEAAPQEARLFLTVRDRETDAPLVARVRIEGLGRTADPELGPAHRADGALDTVIVMRGGSAVSLPPGRYRLRASRGPCWSMETRELAVDAGDARGVELAIEEVVDAGAWLAADFHVHGAASPDSDVTLADRVASLAAEGVALAVPTEHNHVVDLAPSAAALDLGDELGTVPGVEVTTWAPQLGHFNAFPWPYDPEDPRGGAPAFRGQTPEGLFRALHAAGPDVLVQVNHPNFEDGIGYFGLAGPRQRSLDFDAIEVWNGYDLEHLERVESNLEQWMKLVAAGHPVVATGNSDSHEVQGQWAGYPRTYVRSPDGVADPRAAIHALARGEAFVTNGPLLFAGVVAKRSGTTRVRVETVMPEWMSVDELVVYVDGERALETELQTHVSGLTRRGAREVTLTAHPDSFAVFVVRGDTSLAPLIGPRRSTPLAFTNAVALGAPRP